MKEKSKRLAAMFVMGAALLGASSTHVLAGTYIDARNGNLGFTSSWERYTSGDSSRASLTYGYNTAFVNEDYAWANHSLTSHSGYVSNGSGGFSGPTKGAGAVSKIEVTHKGSDIHYMCHYSY